jgi:signal transduction histidine kinase
MDIVLRESERLNDTISSFLAYAQPQRLAVAQIDVRKVLDDTAALLRGSADMREGHTVEVDVPGDPVWYDADEHQLRQVVWNLATNGLRAMAEGGSLRLAAGYDQHAESPGALVIRVTDQGCGIAADQLEHIFQPFRGSFGKGTGLGLAIVHRIVTDYGGTVQVSSTLGSGTIVRICLPRTVTARLPVARPEVAA